MLHTLCTHCTRHTAHCIQDTAHTALVQLIRSEGIISHTSTNMHANTNCIQRNYIGESISKALVQCTNSTLTGLCRWLCICKCIRIYICICRQQRREQGVSTLTQASAGFQLCRNLCICVCICICICMCICICACICRQQWREQGVSTLTQASAGFQLRRKLCAGRTTRERCSCCPKYPNTQTATSLLLLLLTR